MILIHDDAGEAARFMASLYRVVWLGGQEEGIARGAASEAWRPIVQRVAGATDALRAPEIMTTEQAAAFLSITVRAFKARVERGAYARAKIKTGGSVKTGKRGGNGGTVRWRRDRLTDGG